MESWRPQDPSSQNLGVATPTHRIDAYVITCIASPKGGKTIVRYVGQLYVNYTIVKLVP